MPSTVDRCEVCGAELTGQSAARARAGRPARYCSSACRQRAYRQRAAAGQGRDPAGDGDLLAAAPAVPVRRLAPVPLPVPLDSFVGRDRDVSELAELLQRYRLVTLLGPGGAGKTRLSVELATRVQERYPDGVCLVELAALAESGLLAQTVADRVGVPEEVGRTVLDSLVDALRPRDVLLVLDNCEHLVGAVAELADHLLRRCPQLRVLATSREPLDIPGELAYRVGELSLPDGPDVRTAAELAGSAAVRLFVARAAAALPDFELTDDNATDVAAVCTALDGMPLALELAARRVRLLPVAEIRARLADRFRLLTGGPRTVAERHRDLRTTIEWSYDLLDPAEQLVFARLSVFVGGFDLAGATAVCADGPDSGGSASGADVPAYLMLDVLTGLEARSLITADPDRPGRFRQLDSIRLFGRDRLGAGADAVLDRLAGYLLRLARPIVGDGMLHSYEDLQPLDAERDNLLTVTDWAGRRGDDRHLALATALVRCWRHHGYVTDGWQLIRTAIDRAGPDHPARIAATVEAARTALNGGDQLVALALAEEAVRLAEETAPAAPRALAKALDVLGMVTADAGDDKRTEETAHRVLALAGRLPDPLDTAVFLHNQAYHLTVIGQTGLPSELMDRCIPMYRQNSPYPLPAEWLHSAGVLALARGDLDGADGSLREGLERYLPVGDGPGGRTLPTVALVMLDCLAVVAAYQGQPLRAIRLDAAVDLAQRELRLARETGAQRQHDDALAVARAALAADEVRAAEQAGAQLSAAATIRYAVSGVWPDDGAVSPLTVREHDMVRLVADGLTNRQIANRLRMTERSVEAGLRTVRGKLGLRSRAQLAAWSVAHLGDGQRG